METDLSLVRRVGRAAASVSLTGITIPFVFGFSLGELLPESLLPKPDQRLITSLFLGTALSISSVKIVAAVVREMNFVRRNVGQIILASAVIDDTICWIIIAITFGLAAHGTLDWPSLARSVIGTIIFLGVSFTIGRRMVFEIIRWTNDNFISEAAVIAAIIVVMGIMALTTHAIGVHTVLGAFVAGILVGESPILTRKIDEQLRGMTAGLFMPVFFGTAGMGADLTVLKDIDIALLTLGLVFIASLGKSVGAYTGSWLGGLSRQEALALAAGMNARGSTEVIVASIGLSIAALSQTLYTMIVAMAVITTMAMPPTLRLALNRLPLGKEERERLEREFFETHAFLANLERILLAINASAKGKFASRIAGLIAGFRGMPVTVLRIDGRGETRTTTTDLPLPKLAKNEDVELVRTAAESAVRPEGNLRDISVLERRHDMALGKAVETESQKGHDLLVIGIEPTVAPGGGFTDELSEIAGGFSGSLAVISARGKHEQNPIHSDLSILVPVTGLEVSRRGAEIAIALAKAAQARLTVISVAAAAADARRSRFGTARHEVKEILKEIALVAEYYDQPIETLVRTEIATEDAILRQARLGNHNLIVMGVSRRPGKKLSFGNIATALLESSDRSLMFISS
jgi:Kef-type K+ transport system membrane component KefB/nucleotide-binding universal stress UspA family protein